MLSRILGNVVVLHIHNEFCGKLAMASERWMHPFIKNKDLVR